MKRSSFRKLTWEEAIAKQASRNAKARERAKLVKAGKKRSTGVLGAKKPKPKADRVKTLKTKLWKAWSIHIRTKWADHAGYVTTCDTGERKHWKEVHCGHLWANTERNQQLGGNELWYYENNFAPQTAIGNSHNKDDSGKKYMAWAINRYGYEEVMKMRRMKETYKLWTEEELTTLYENLP